VSSTYREAFKQLLFITSNAPIVNALDQPGDFYDCADPAFNDRVIQYRGAEFSLCDTLGVHYARMLPKQLGSQLEIANPRE